MFRSFSRLACVSALVLTAVGCGQPVAPASKPNVTAAASTAKDSSTAGTEEPASAASDSTKPKRKAFQPVQLGGEAASSDGSSADTGEKFASVRAALKPLQILIGSWNGTSRNAALDQPGWAWDLKTDRKQPALKIKSEKGKYIRDGRLTFLPASQEFEFTATDGDSKQHVFRGTFSEPVQDVPGDDKKMQRTYKLQLTESAADADGEQWRLVINQQENNRYILEVDRKRGTGMFNRVDTINIQREGTSFALSDTDYGDKTCIISQGLGTISVSHKGQTYWVCCTGCKAAFEEEPDRWIAKFVELQKMKK